MKIQFLDTDLGVFTKAKQTIEEQLVDVTATRCSSEEYLGGLSELSQLVILDLDSPNIDGPSVFEKIRGKSKVPIIVLGDIEPGMNRLIKTLHLGATDFLFKPIQDSRLISVIAHYSKVEHTC